MARKRIVRAFGFIFPIMSVAGCVVLVPFIEPHNEPAESSPIPSSASLSPHSAAQRPVNPKAAQYIKRHVAQLQDSRPTKRAAAASYLGMMGPDAAPAIPALIAHLSDDSKNVRRACVKSLGKIGVRSPEVETALERSTHDKDPYVAQSAKNALGELRSQPIAGSGASPKSNVYTVRSNRRVSE